MHPVIVLACALVFTAAKIGFEHGESVPEKDVVLRSNLMRIFGLEEFEILLF